MLFFLTFTQIEKRNKLSAFKREVKNIARKIKLDASQLGNRLQDGRTKNTSCKSLL